jgi:hypothetical protein
MNSTTLEYKRKVWQFLEKIKPDKRYTVAKLAKPENLEAFVEAIKEYMASFPYQGWISFNADYTKFYKSSPIPWKQLNRK